MYWGFDSQYILFTKQKRLPATGAYLIISKVKPPKGGSDMPTIKTINDFTIAVHTALSAAFPACSIEPVNVTKNNDVHRTGLTICPSSNKIIAPTIYTDMYFDAFQSGQPAGNNYRPDCQHLYGCFVLC